MLLAYFDIAASEKELEKICGTTELGTTPTQIVGGASKFNLNLVATKNASIDDLKEQLKNKNPVIALIDPSYIYGGVSGFGHFIVILGVEENKIVYHDPHILNGEYKRCDIKVFIKAWSIFKRWMIGVEK